MPPLPEQALPQDNERSGAASAILVIGVGNEQRSDDAVGLYVARELRLRVASCEHCFPKNLAVIEQSGEGTALMRAWEGYRHVLIVDAIRSGDVPGTLLVHDAIAQPVPRRLFLSSSHHFGVAEAIEMARALGCLPQTLVLYGVEAETFEPGMGLSESVVRSMNELLRKLEEDIKALSTLDVAEKS